MISHQNICGGFYFLLSALDLLCFPLLLFAFCFLRKCYLSQCMGFPTVGYVRRAKP